MVAIVSRPRHGYSALVRNSIEWAGYWPLTMIYQGSRAAQRDRRVLAAYGVTVGEGHVVGAPACRATCSVSVATV